MEPALLTVKRLFALSGNQCAFPSCDLPIVEDSGTVTGIICHIKGRKSGGPRYDPNQTEKERHAFSNLILLCSRHSKLIDSEPERFTSNVLVDMKRSHEKHPVGELSPDDALRAELLLKHYRDVYVLTGDNVMVNSPGGFQVTNLVIKNPKRKSVQIAPPDGSLASRLSMRNYIKHLIDRYNEFASQQPGRDFRYPRIYATIKKEFGAKWDLIPVDRFDQLVSFLQRRIDTTMRGRMNRGGRVPNYSTYDQYLEKY